MKTVAIVQSNYIPWKGYFDLLNSVDEFILFDEVQYTKRDWRNRNRIKTAQGVQWLTVPVKVKGRYHQRIDETVISDPSWAARHWKTLTHAYAGAPHFEDYRDELSDLYLGLDAARLSDVNRILVEWIAGQLGSSTRISWSSDYDAVAGRPAEAATGDPTERLIALCEAAGAERYVSGPAARAYMEETAFSSRGIELGYFDYSGYPEYEQLHPPFDHHVTVLDLLFSKGGDAAASMKTFGRVSA